MTEGTDKLKPDLITIGAGSGGVAASRRAAAHGARVLIVEGDRVGGTCVIRGCVPKKLMMYAAGFSGALREAGGFGWTDVGGRFEMSRWADAKAQEIDRLKGIYRDMLAASGVELAIGHARLTGPGSVEVAGRDCQTPRILLATGGAPSTVGIPGLELAMTSNDVLELRDVPESVLVLGAGYIAVEFASILSGLGSRVTLAYRGALPLRGFDDDLRSRLVHALERQGVTLAGAVALTTLRSTGAGFAPERADGSVLTAAAALNATGRNPNTAGLNLDTAGAALDHRHGVVVDSGSRTTAPGLWAIGDVTNRVNLTPVAIAEGRAFADTEFGKRPSRVDHRTVASAAFTDPPIATVGLTEEDATAHGPVDICESEYRPMKTAFAGGSSRTCVKLVVDGLDDRVLGVHMLGTDAPEIVQSLAVAITCGTTKRDFDRTIAVHPTAADEFVLLREPARRTAAGPQVHAATT
jgi:glutathione reductase (NADPH)